LVEARKVSEIWWNLDIFSLEQPKINNLSGSGGKHRRKNPRKTQLHISLFYPSLTSQIKNYLPFTTS